MSSLSHVRQTRNLNGTDSLGLAFEQVTDKNNQVFYKQYVQAAGRVVLSITTPQEGEPYEHNVPTGASVYRFLRCRV